jgi:hypothetical protein
MKAGNSRYDVDTRIRITYIASTDPDDLKLVGRTGRLTHPFGDSPGSALGVWLDPTPDEARWLREHEGQVLPDAQTRTGLIRSDRFEVISASIVG